MQRRGTVVMLCLLGASLFAVPTAAQTGTRCSDLFPEARWVAAGSGSVDIGFSEVPNGQAERFTAEIGETAGLLETELGGLDGAAVCVVGADSTFDTGRYVEPTRRFHAVLDHPNDALVLSAENPGNIKRSSAFGLPHLALWNLSGDEGWPEPLASTIAHWYRARALDRMAQYRVESTGADFSVDPVTGEGNFGLDFSTEARIEWTESVQIDVRSWDPSRNEAPIGYFIEYTVAQEGLGALTDVDPDAWRSREEAWRTSLLVDLTGRTEPTTEWILGLSIALLFVVVAAVFATAGIVQKRRRTRSRSTAN